MDICIFYHKFTPESTLSLIVPTMKHFIFKSASQRNSIYALFLVLALPFVNSAQNIRFSYDTAGNRIKREIIMETKALDTKSTTDCFSESIAKQDIKIYPNPTDGIIKVEISVFDDTDICEISIFNASGQLLLSRTASSSITEVDIVSQPKGIYIMRISLNGNDSIWKIIKK